MPLKEGDAAPDFTLLDQDGREFSLSSLRGRRVLVYFYPKDNTPGCTTEAKNFQAALDRYGEAGVEIVGISKDSVASHRKFADKYGLKFRLLSDPQLVAAKAFGALVGGRVKRRTWLVDEDWKVEKFWDDVSPSKHNAEVCAHCGIRLPDLG